MLTHIYIQHFAIVQSLSLDFQKGLHVLTGETGAGKSIWVDALQIGLGERADASVIHGEASHCDITLCFDCRELPIAQQWLASHDFVDTHECIIRRVIYKDKPSRSTLNGTPIPQQWVREFSQWLLCVHGQHQHQRLFKSSEQRHLLDQYAGHDHLLQTVQAHYEQWKDISEQLTTLTLQAKNKADNQSLWQYQWDEIQSLQLKDNEFQESFQKYQQLHAAKNTITALNETLALLSNDTQPAAADLLHQARKQLQRIKSPNNTLLQIQALLESATIQCDEATSSLSVYCSDTDFQLTQLDELEQRLQMIQAVARKHHVEPEQLPAIEKNLSEQLHALETIDAQINTLKTQQKNIETDYQKTAKQLSASREKAAKKMSVAITLHMQTLGMPGGHCDILVEPMTPGVHPFGNESVAFLVSTNPGLAPKPLSQTVSGGELSRLSLICHVLNAQVKNTPTLIFDEVDVGIGGQTADTVGRLLRQLAEQTQVLCITHLPQVAAKGHHHFKAVKVSDKQQTSTTIHPLSPDERTAEIARMLSGSNVTEKSLSHASELLANSSA